jgi:hypothetical protein
MRLARPFARQDLLSGIVLLCACATGGTPQSAQAPQDASDYEVYNPTACAATVFTFDQTGLNREVIGSVPSGGRVVFHVLPSSRVSGVGAHAVASDGTNCEHGERVRVRRLPTPPPS